ncbi:hypothetical protein [Alkalibacter mobilis]|uniref:hypothetical protein n=1 Tax=Alkalibacter mobilis TaxID=2787712 RepID=UPI00189ECE4B|nr:hypothetical protein [Alkalibacter mobilis]MBF7097381.1 hypothetical protein [Alkalibacter mobilis]
MKKILMPILLILVIWIGMFITDYKMSINLKEPVFVIPIETADSEGREIYQGLGYKVYVEFEGNDKEGQIISVTMKILNKIVGASIS